MFKVGLDTRMARHTGIGRYIQGLLKYGNSVVQYVSFGAAFHGFIPCHALRSKIFSISEQLEIPFKQITSNIELWHSPQFNLPLLVQVPAVVTIHDLALDFFPKEFPNRAAQLYYKTLMPRVLKKARAVLTVSQTTRRALIERYGISEEKVHAVPLSIETDFFSQKVSQDAIAAMKERFGIKDHYMLYVGIRKPRKNLEVLIQALPLIDESFKLVIAGPKDNRYIQLVYLARQYGVADRVIETGALEDDETLKALYQGASLVVLPSLYEGFGLTLLEAMACQSAVLASDIETSREILGAAGYFFDPRSHQDLARGANALLLDESLRKKLVQQGQNQLKKFSWMKTVEETARVYEKVLGACPT